MFAYTHKNNHKITSVEKWARKYVIQVFIPMAGRKNLVEKFVCKYQQYFHPRWINWAMNTTDNKDPFAIHMAKRNAT